MTDDIRAFVPGVDVHIVGAADGPLAGLTFVAKDLFDVAGYPTGAGNHDWATYNPLPTRHMRFSTFANVTRRRVSSSDVP